MTFQDSQTSKLELLHQKLMATIVLLLVEWLAERVEGSQKGAAVHAMRAMNCRKFRSGVANAQDHRRLAPHDVIRLEISPDRVRIDCRVLKQKSPPKIEGRRVALLARLVVLAG